MRRKYRSRSRDADMVLRPITPQNKICEFCGYDIETALAVWNVYNKKFWRQVCNIIPDSKPAQEFRAMADRGKVPLMNYIPTSKARDSTVIEGTAK
jgi:hypothetical protein